jgi:hypothetical protein
MRHKPTTTKQIDEIIKSLKAKDSHGHDLNKDPKTKLPIYNFTFKLHM